MTTRASERASRCKAISCWGLRACSAREVHFLLLFFIPDIKYFIIDQACSVKIARHWPRSFFCVFLAIDSVSEHKHPIKKDNKKIIIKKELGQYPGILTSRLDNNPYFFFMAPMYRWITIFYWQNVFLFWDVRVEFPLQLFLGYSDSVYKISESMTVLFTQLILLSTDFATKSML